MRNFNDPKIHDFKSKAFVLRRTNYGESDRIINFLTPSGTKSAIAKSSRKEKSKLAGGIEMFCLSDIIIHNSSKGGLGILTSAKSKIFYENIIKDFDTFELASFVIKSSAKLSDSADSPELFDLVKEVFEALNLKLLPLIYIHIYYILNYAEISGEGINLITDANGEKLDKDSRYYWDSISKVFIKDEKGKYNANYIKVLRLMLASNLKTISRIKGLSSYDLTAFLHFI